MVVEELYKTLAELIEEGKGSYEIVGNDFSDITALIECPSGQFFILKE